MSIAEFKALVSSPFADDAWAADDGAHLVLVDAPAALIPEPGMLPAIVCVLGDIASTESPSGADVIVGDEDLRSLVTSVSASPIAATTLAVHLRSVASLNVDAALAAESASYSVLQSGSEFRNWHSRRPSGRPAVVDVNGQLVVTERAQDELTITLNRPYRHNAISARLRDELHAALAIAVLDETVERVVLRGAGPSFCSGGDLDEFGTFPDPATAHHVRLARSVAQLMSRLSGRTEAHLHGAAIGGGIEIAAFAGRVVADRDTRIALPEVAFGLMPGAGGTISVSRRIGRHRTAWLALTGREIDAATALGWGLVDEVT